MKIYTKTGDDGETGLFAGPRVRKDHPRVEAYGAVDELNSLLGVVRAESPPAEIDQILAQTQHALFSLGSELATPDPQKNLMTPLGPSHVECLERAIDEWEAKLTPLRVFILPAGTRIAAGLHLARTVCRRAERRLVTLCDGEGERIRSETVQYLNRLSDLLFVLARAANAAEGVSDEPWRKEAP